jgi:hypothetical protein
MPSRDVGVLQKMGSELFCFLDGLMLTMESCCTQAIGPVIFCAVGDHGLGGAAFTAILRGQDEGRAGDRLGLLCCSTGDGRLAQDCFARNHRDEGKRLEVLERSFVEGLITTRSRVSGVVLGYGKGLRCYPGWMQHFGSRMLCHQ